MTQKIEKVCQMFFFWKSTPLDWHFFVIWQKLCLTDFFGELHRAKCWTKLLRASHPLSFGERNEGFHKSGIPNSWMVSIKNGWFGGNPTLGSLQMITWTHTYIYVGKLNKNGSTTFIKWREMIISGERSNRPKSQVSFAARGIGFLKKEKTLKEIPFSISNHKPTISCRLPNIVDVWSVQSLPGILCLSSVSLFF